MDCLRESLSDAKYQNLMWQKVFAKQLTALYNRRNRPIRQYSTVGIGPVLKVGLLLPRDGGEKS